MKYPFKLIDHQNTLQTTSKFIRLENETFLLFNWVSFNRKLLSLIWKNLYPTTKTLTLRLKCSVWESQSQPIQWLVLISKQPSFKSHPMKLRSVVSTWSKKGKFLPYMFGMTSIRSNLNHLIRKPNLIDHGFWYFLARLDYQYLLSILIKQQYLLNFYSIYCLNLHIISFKQSAPIVKSLTPSFSLKFI